MARTSRPSSSWNAGTAAVSRASSANRSAVAPNGICISVLGASARNAAARPTGLTRELAASPSTGSAMARIDTDALTRSGIASATRMSDFVSNHSGLGIACGRSSGNRWR